jgi:peptide subunit release factor 1 (eRF1)
MTAHTIIVRNQDDELLSQLRIFFDVQYHPQQGVYELVGMKHDALASFAANVARNVLPKLSEDQHDLFFYQLQALYNTLMKQAGDD